MDINTYIKRHRLKLQLISFIGIMVLPFLLYWASQVHAANALRVLLGMMALLMLAIIITS